MWVAPAGLPAHTSIMSFASLASPKILYPLIYPLPALWKAKNCSNLKPWLPNIKIKCNSLHACKARAPSSPALIKMASHSATVETLYAGLMSGTSLDGVDGVIARFNPQGRPTFLAMASCPLPDALSPQLLELNLPGEDDLHKAAMASNALAEIYAQTIAQLLKETGLHATEIEAIGAHGQTVRHQPQLGYSIQLNAPALLAELSQIAVIADFRARDIAAQGQGAPLVPAFHQELFQPDAPCVVLNLGGIANISVIRKTGDIQGFDTGPANMLLDAWIQKHQQRA